MRAGELRHRVELQEKTETQTALGVTETWRTVATLWADVRDLAGREYYAAAQTQTEVTTRVRIRYRAGVTPAWRLLHGARTLEIRSVIDPDGRRRELQLMCKDVT